MNIDDYDILAGWALVDIEPADVKEIIHYREGENDDSSWLFVLEMTDGRFAYVSAWCDYTGWGCRDGADVSYAESLDALIPEMDTEGRMAFGYEPTPDCGV
jgi:hypothetical protein